MSVFSPIQINLELFIPCFEWSLTIYDFTNISYEGCVTVCLSLTSLLCSTGHFLCPWTDNWWANSPSQFFMNSLVFADLLLKTLESTCQVPSKPYWDFDWNLLNLQLSLEKTSLFLILSLPDQEHGISLHLDISSLLSFNSCMIFFI